MRLVIEKICGDVYVYRETETQFLRNEKKRTSPKLTLKDLDHNCNLHNHPADCHISVRYA